MWVGPLVKTCGVKSRHTQERSLELWIDLEVELDPRFWVYRRCAKYVNCVKNLFLSQATRKDTVFLGRQRCN